MAWQLVNISWITNYMTVAGWQNIADLIGGEVKSAEDWGMTSVSGLYADRPQPTIDALAIYVPDGANYGLIAFGGGGTGTYYQNARFYIVPMETGDVTAEGTCRSGINQMATTLRVWAGDGFAVVTTLANNQYLHGGFAIDTFEDATNDRTVVGVVGVDSVGTYSSITGYDLEYGSGGSVAPVGTVVSQSDGSLYFEVIKMPLVFTSGGYVTKVLMANNIYEKYYDYNYNDKSVLVNGIVFAELLESGIYFPTE